MDVIVTSPIGTADSLRLLSQYEERLRERYTERYLKQAEERLSVWKENTFPETLLHDTACVYESDGTDGISGMLWRLAEREKTGLRIDLRKIPVLQETIEIANTLDIDPYRMQSNGMLIFCKGGKTVAERLIAEGFGYATVIGQTSADRKRLLLYDDIERYLTKPQKNRG